MPIPTFLKQWLKPAVVRLRWSRNTLGFYRDRLVSVDKDAFGAAVRRLGVRPGDMVFVLSSFDQVRCVRATAPEIVGMLVDAVGPDGTLAMPTFPMSGLSQEYLDSHPVFDCRRTPSRSGMLTEVFRRMPGTERSVHPTHPIAARGAGARWLTAGHERSRTPFDEHSPFMKLLERDALVLRIGRFDAMPVRHLADHLMQDEIPHPIYADRETRVRARGAAGEDLVVLTRAHNPALHCDHQVVLERMRREGLVRSARVRRLMLSLVRTRAYVDAYRRLHRAGAFGHVLKSGAAADAKASAR
jgi:aminoglycoside 3-N-acetyltransferase